MRFHKAIHVLGIRLTSSNCLFPFPDACSNEGSLTEPEFALVMFHGLLLLQYSGVYFFFLPGDRLLPLETCIISA